MSALRLYRQDVIGEMGDGTLLFNDDVIDGDCPPGGANVDLVELDGTITRVAVLGYRLMLRPTSEQPSLEGSR